ncbi:MAG: glycosyltransferase family 2 protein, partial [Planctomycetota bacterium]
GEVSDTYASASKTHPPARAPEGYNPAEAGRFLEDGPRIDVMIPTLNESRHIAEAVANAASIGRVHVLDSFSTDGTQQLARDAGATVIEHEFENYSRQKNWGLKHLPMEGDWVFILDADERITPRLADALVKAAQSGAPETGYFVNRINLMMGQPIRFGGLYPSWNLRFFRRGKARYEDRSVHEHMFCDGPTSYLTRRARMLHIRLETMSDYVHKHIKYADMESNEWVRLAMDPEQWKKEVEQFPPGQRMRLWLRRKVTPNLPFRPAIRFLYMYIVQLGFLDGRAGYHLAMLMADYEYMISLLFKEKLERARREAKGETIVD